MNSMNSINSMNSMNFFRLNGFHKLNRRRLLLLALSYILFCCSPAFGDGPSAWLNINYTGTEQYANGEKTGSSDSLYQNYYFNFNQSINPLLSYQFHIRTSLRDSSSKDSKGNETNSYLRAIEPAIDIFFRNPIYGLDAGYRRLEQWPSAHIANDSRKTTEFYYSRFSLTPDEFPSLSLQFDRQSNYDHLSIKALDNTTTTYSANSWYQLSYKGLRLAYNLSYTRNENERPLSQAQVIAKTINDGFNATYNIAYNKSFWDNIVTVSAGYQGNYNWNKNEQSTTRTGNVPFKRTPLFGMYGLGTQIEPNVDTLAAANTLTDSIYDVPAKISTDTINVGQNGNKFNNIGIQLSSSEQSVDMLYIYVNKDVLPDTVLININNWKVYQSNFNLPGTWKEITIQTVTASVSDILNNVYRYEIKFSTPQNALFFRAINLEIATASDVLVTEIEAFGTEAVSSSGKITGTSTFLTQGINFNASLRPLNSLTFSVNYFLNRADQQPKSIIDSIEGAFSNLLTKPTTEVNEDLRSNITRTYGANATWLAHRLLTTTAHFQRNEAFDNKGETDFSSNTYSLTFSSSPLPTLDTNLSLIKTYSYSFNKKQSMNDLYILTINSHLYKDVNMITDAGYTQSRTYVMVKSSATPATENTESSTRYINGTIDTRLTPDLFLDITYGYSQTSGGSTSSSSNNGSIIVTYRPGRFINTTGSFRFSDTNGGTSTAEGFSVDWLVLPTIRLNLNYQHTNTEPGSSTADTISSYAMWYITKFLYVQLTYNYSNVSSNTKAETYSFGGNLTCRFW
jgi:hypothetical protein